MDSFKIFLTENLDLEREILSMYQGSTHHVREISGVTGISVAGIYRVLEKYGVKPHRRVVSDPHGVVSQYHSSGIPARKISELTGYSTRQVYNIIKGLANLNS